MTSDKVTAAGASGGGERWMSPAEAMKFAWAHYNAGRLDQAERIARQVAGHGNGHPDAFQMVAVIAYRLGRYKEAVASMEKGVQRAPAVPAFHSNLSEMCRVAGQLDRAVASARTAIALDAGHAQAYNNLGIALYEQGDKAEAEASYRKAIELRLAFPEAWNNLGNVVRDFGREDEALTAYNKAIENRPDYSEALANKGLMLREQGDLKGAEQSFRQAVGASPRNANAAVCLAMIRLLQGDPGGWPTYEARLNLPGVRPPRLPGRPWQNDSLTGKRVLVHSEQGLGDTINFLRYLPKLQAMEPKELLFLSPPRLRPFLEENLKGVTVIGKSGAAADVDSVVSLLSLPYKLDARSLSLPMTAPYLHADEAKVVQWRERLAARAKAPGDLKVGLAWAGSPSHKNDANRSMPFEALLPLLDLPGVTFFSLQIGLKADEVNKAGGRIVDLQREVDNWPDTAAAIAALDLVVSVDTSIIHMTGALGRPGWLLLAQIPDWRWGLSGERTDWYPSLRLFRQGNRRDWAGTVAAVRQALESEVASRQPA
jgi:tetratricopeptide (TPR) repeat protein